VLVVTVLAVLLAVSVVLVVLLSMLVVLTMLLGTSRLAGCLRGDSSGGSAFGSRGHVGAGVGGFSCSLVDRLLLVEEAEETSSSNSRSLSSRRVRNGHRCSRSFGGSSGGIYFLSIFAVLVVVLPVLSVLVVMVVMVLAVMVLVVVLVVVLRWRGAGFRCCCCCSFGRSSRRCLSSGRSNITGIKIFQVHIVHTDIEITVVTFNQVEGVLKRERHDGTSVGEASNDSESGCRRHF